MMNPFKALTKLLFWRSSQGGGNASAPFFGPDFSIWNQFWATGGKQSSINYEQELGSLQTSALFMAAFSWVSRGLNGARLTVVDVDANGLETEIRDHPLTALVTQPNAYYNDNELFSGFALSWLSRASAYWLIVEDNAGDVSELWYEPADSIRAVWPEDGSSFISGYQVNRNGEWRDVDSASVLAFRGSIDPITREPYNATSCLLREYYTDKQAAEFSALLMKQGLVPPLIVALGDKDRQVTPEDMKEFKDGLSQLMSTPKAGQPAVINAPAEVSMLNYDYSKIGMRDIRAIPEERFCAAMGISAYSLHFGISRTASTFSNVEQYLKHDYRAYIVPLHRYIAKRLTYELLPRIDATPNLRVCFNYDDVPLMQPDLNEIWGRIVNAYRARVIDQAQALEALSYKPDPSQQGVYYPVPAASTTEDEIEPPEPQAQLPTFTDANPAMGQDTTRQ